MNKRDTLKMIGAIYGAMLIFVLLVSLMQFAADALRFAIGDITTSEYTAEDLVLKDFTLTENGTIVSTSPDPQLIIENYNARSTMLKIKFTFSRYPGEVNLYYTHKDEEFTNAQKVWGIARNDGSYEFIMPRGVLSRIRLDPTSFENNEISINEFVLNPRRGFLTYFSYSGEGVFKFILYGAFMCCLVSFIYTDFNAQCKAFFTKIKSIKKKA